MTPANATPRGNVNGVDVAKMYETIDTVQSTPSLGSFKFRVRNQWQGGGRNQSTIKDFYGCGQQMEHPRPFTLVADEPPLLLGQDAGANPVEYLLHALAACVTTSMVYHAAAKGIAIEQVESSIEGDIDLQGFLGLDPNIRPGYRQIRMKFRIKADADEEQLRELAALGPQFSPVFDSVSKGVPVQVTAERMA